MVKAQAVCAQNKPPNQVEGHYILPVHRQKKLLIKKFFYMKKGKPILLFTVALFLTTPCLLQEKRRRNNLPLVKTSLAEQAFSGGSIFKGVRSLQCIFKGPNQLHSTYMVSSMGNSWGSNYVCLRPSLSGNLSVVTNYSLSSPLVPHLFRKLSP